jgi:nitrate/nitrite transporter NarK
VAGRFTGHALVAEAFPRDTDTVTGLVSAAGGVGGFFPPILMGLVRDATCAYSIGFGLLSEIAPGCLIANLLAMQRPGSPMWGAHRTASFARCPKVRPTCDPSLVHVADDSERRGWRSFW